MRVTWPYLYIINPLSVKRLKDRYNVYCSTGIIKTLLHLSGFLFLPVTSEIIRETLLSCNFFFKAPSFPIEIDVLEFRRTYVKQMKGIDCTVLSSKRRDIVLSTEISFSLAASRTRAAMQNSLCKVHYNCTLCTTAAFTGLHTAIPLQSRFRVSAFITLYEKR